MAPRIETAEDLERIVDEQNSKIAALETHQANLLGLIDTHADTIRKMQGDFDRLSGELHQAVLEAREKTSGRKGPVN
jgi:hypothetical protein